MVISSHWPFHTTNCVQRTHTHTHVPSCLHYFSLAVNRSWAYARHITSYLRRIANVFLENQANLGDDSRLCRDAATNMSYDDIYNARHRTQCLWKQSSQSEFIGYWPLIFPFSHVIEFISDLQNRRGKKKRKQKEKKEKKNAHKKIATIEFWCRIPATKNTAQQRAYKRSIFRHSLSERLSNA